MEKLPDDVLDKIYRMKHELEFRETVKRLSFLCCKYCLELCNSRSNICSNCFNDQFYNQNFYLLRYYFRSYFNL